ncbi:hypothetical protein CTKZ_08390 [Cellulomonas algicola]|uniref:DUF2399 domain-containing protein n=1 Tax=Cellulomonas algicola TaxID=2071633 RepID=A0A401UX57_9CELL|nr:DUF2399 domain-containing protein [Cellulomonas algicola]GCD19277.1 hypothetical protein CTKZ_08390 [Cellulomonas algicola]
MTCRVCQQDCAALDVTRFVDDDLLWLWAAVADAGDRRGDIHMVEGFITVTAPASAEERSAGQSLTGNTPLKAHARRRVDLAHLTRKLSTTAPGITPGMVAAHATRRTLGARVRARAQRDVTRSQMRQAVVDGVASLPPHVACHLDAEGVWEHLRRNKWAGSLERLPDWRALMGSVFAILAELPSGNVRRDRRFISAALGSPHALDEGMRTASLAQAVLVGGGWVPAGLAYRDAWEYVGVHSDDVIGGVSCLGVLPAGWSIPAGSLVTIPPRELVRAPSWGGPRAAGQLVFVTENPSILTAAADRYVEGDSPVICINGTPSSRELGALALLPVAGWRVAVRADFDQAGLRHVRDMLAAIAGAVPWRMGADDYMRSLTLAGADPLAALNRVVGETPWDPALAVEMRNRRQAAYEEVLVDDLMADISAGRVH